MVSARKKRRIKKVYSTQKVYTFLGFPKSRVGNDAEHICGLDHPNAQQMSFRERASLPEARPSICDTSR